MSSPEERALYGAFASAWARYDAIGREAVKLAQAGRTGEGIRLMADPAHINLYNTVRDVLGKDIALNEHGAHVDADRAIDATDAAPRWPSSPSASACSPPSAPPSSSSFGCPVRSRR